MRLFRIVKDKHISSAWSGFGAKLFGGRWNHPGKSMVYVSSSVSLAILEILVHVQRSELLNHFSVLQIDIADDKLQTLDLNQLSENWNNHPAVDETMDLGDTWLVANEAVGLLVPSAVVPMERNVILNPNHPDFYPAIVQAITIPLPLDSRLFKSSL